MTGALIVIVTPLLSMSDRNSGPVQRMSENRPPDDRKSVNLFRRSQELSNTNGHVLDLSNYFRKIESEFFGSTPNGDSYAWPPNVPSMETYKVPRVYND